MDNEAEVKQVPIKISIIEIIIIWNLFLFIIENSHLVNNSGDYMFFGIL
jgi:hypothetical protein